MNTRSSLRRESKQAPRISPYHWLTTRAAGRWCSRIFSSSLSLYYLILSFRVTNFLFANSHNTQPHFIIGMNANILHFCSFCKPTFSGATRVRDALYYYIDYVIFTTYRLVFVMFLCFALPPIFWQAHDMEYALKKTRRPSVRERTIPTERLPLVAKLVPTSADRGCCVVSTTNPYSRILGFLGRIEYIHS
jgi:hypothetical protein